MIQKWVESSRGRTFYWTSMRKDAPVLVFLHGLAADHTLFDKQFEYFRERFSILAWDAPAQGASRPYDDFSLLHCAVELKRILDAEQIGRCVLIGHALGAMVAQEFLMRWPERVRGFVGIAASPMEKRFYSKAELCRIARAGQRAQLLPFHTLHWAMAHAAGHNFYARANMRMALQTYERRELCALLRRAGIATVRELVNEAELHCPAMLLIGAKDHTRGVRARCAAWHSRSGIPLYSVRAAGHNANADNPLSVNRLLHAFVNSLPDELPQRHG